MKAREDPTGPSLQTPISLTDPPVNRSRTEAEGRMHPNRNFFGSREIAGLEIIANPVRLRDLDLALL